MARFGRPKPLLGTHTQLFLGLRFAELLLGDPLLTGPEGDFGAFLFYRCLVEGDRAADGVLGGGCVESPSVFGGRLGVQGNPT
jgi:hypothetical protein